MKTVVSDVNGLDPETGELVFVFDTVEEVTSATPEEQANDLNKFTNGDPANAMKRYKAVQGWATRVHQENLAMKQQLGNLEQQVSKLSNPSKPAVALPEVADPGPPNMDDILTNPEQLQSFVVQTIHSQLGLVGEYVQSQLEPFRPLLTAYTTHNELQTAAAKHADLAYWTEEMQQVSRGLSGDQEMTIEQLYLTARANHPEKARQIDSGTYQHNKPEDPAQPAEPKQEETTHPALEPAQPASGTETQNPETQQTSAPTATQYNPAAPPRQETAAPNQLGVPAEELQQLADRNSTETGVAVGSSPEPAAQGLDAAMEGAWNDVTGGGSP